MAQIKDYTEKTTPTDTDEFIFQETSGGTTKKITKSNLFNSVETDISDLQAQLLGTKAKITLESGGFWGDILYKDSDEIVIKPKPYPGIAAFVGAILNDGSFIESASEYTVKYDVPGSSGHIIDGITAKLNNEWLILWAYEDSGNNLAFGITWQPYTTFSNSNPTTTLTLNQVNSQDIGFLFSANSHVVIWQDTDELETPFGYNDGGAFTYDLTNDTETSISSRTSTVLTLGGTLNNTTFNSSSTVYQIDNFKPLQQSDGSIASVIGSNGYMDTGFRFRTNGSGNIFQFAISGKHCYFTNGQGVGADNEISGGTNLPPSNFAITTSWVNYISTYIPNDKIPVMYYNQGNQTVFSKRYYDTYGTATWYSNGGTNEVSEENLAIHKIMSLRTNFGTGRFGILGYIM